jgi:hypothetical protein
MLNASLRAAKRLTHVVPRVAPAFAAAVNPSAAANLMSTMTRGFAVGSSGKITQIIGGALNPTQTPQTRASSSRACA